MNYGPLSAQIVLGAPLLVVLRVMVLTTCSPLMPDSTSMAKASRVKASRAFKSQSFRLSNSASDPKSINHSALAFLASGWRLRLAALILPGRVPFGGVTGW